MTNLDLKIIFVLLIGLTVTCPLIKGQIKKGSETHEQVELSNESEGIGKDNSRLQTVEGKVKQPNPKVRSRHAKDSNLPVFPCILTDNIHLFNCNAFCILA